MNTQFHNVTTSDIEVRFYRKYLSYKRYHLRLQSHYWLLSIKFYYVEYFIKRIVLKEKWISFLSWTTIFYYVMKNKAFNCFQCYSQDFTFLFVKIVCLSSVFNICNENVLAVFLYWQDKIVSQSWSDVKRIRYFIYF